MKQPLLISELQADILFEVINHRIEEVEEELSQDIVEATKVSYLKELKELNRMKKNLDTLNF